jgi:CHAT domain-containing protein
LVVTEPVPISNEIYLVGRFAAQRAFFYAGGRSLLVSHWEVETNSAVALMTETFAALAPNPQLSHGEALR